MTGLESPPTGDDVGRPRREQLLAAAASCGCILHAHCSPSRADCALNAGATVNEGGGICRPTREDAALRSAEELRFPDGTPPRRILSLLDRVAELEEATQAADLEKPMDAQVADATIAELKARLADAAAILASVTVDEDTGYLGENTGGLLSALDHALRGSCGCVEPDEWREGRRRALAEHGEYLGLDRGSELKPPMRQVDAVALHAELEARQARWHREDERAALKDAAKIADATIADQEHRITSLLDRVSGLEARAARLKELADHRGTLLALKAKLDSGAHPDRVTVLEDAIARLIATRLDAVEIRLVRGPAAE